MAVKVLMVAGYSVILVATSAVVASVLEQGHSEKCFHAESVSAKTITSFIKEKTLPEAHTEKPVVDTFQGCIINILKTRERKKKKD